MSLTKLGLDTLLLNLGKNYPKNQNHKEKSIKSSLTKISKPQFLTLILSFLS